MENQFRQYPLEEDILGALDALGYTQPTEIQAAVIPSILNGRDIIAKSKTGSGKTAAFAIPICNFADWEQNTAQALVLEPTRELAFQVKDELYAIGRFKRLKVPVLYGGFPMEKQILTLKQKTHIVVGTPGRVLDHCKRGTLDLSKVRYVVIDEADLMLDMGFIHDVRKIIALLPRKRQTLLFSATMPAEVEKLAAEALKPLPELPPLPTISFPGDEKKAAQQPPEAAVSVPAPPAAPARPKTRLEHLGDEVLAQLARLMPGEKES